MNEAATDPDADAVLDFWFGSADSAEYGRARRAWFAKDDAFDGAIRERFGGTIERALRGELEAWAERVQRQAWDDAYVFFKHEDEGKGPRFAVQFRALLR